MKIFFYINFNSKLKKVCMKDKVLPKKFKNKRNLNITC